jgi:hypothetical protein
MKIVLHACFIDSYGVTSLETVKMYLLYYLMHTEKIDH